MHGGDGRLLWRKILHRKNIESDCTLAETTCAHKCIKICVYFSANPVWHATSGNGAFNMNVTDNSQIAVIGVSWKVGWRSTGNSDIAALSHSENFEGGAIKP